MNAACDKRPAGGPARPWRRAGLVGSRGFDALLTEAVWAPQPLMWITRRPITRDPTITNPEDRAPAVGQMHVSLSAFRGSSWQEAD